MRKQKYPKGTHADAQGKNFRSHRKATYITQVSSTTYLQIIS